MKFSKQLILVAVSLLWLAASHVRADVITDEGAFLGATGTRNLHEFNDITETANLLSTSYSVPGGTSPFTYTINSLDPTPPPAVGGFLWGLMVDDGFDGNPAITVGNEFENLLISITSMNVNAIGGRFFTTTDGGSVIVGEGSSVTVTLRDFSNNVIYTSPAAFSTGLTGFWGFSTENLASYIASVEIHNPNTSGAFATLDHFYVAAVPEASTWLTSGVMVLVIGLVAFYYHRRKTANA